MKIKNFEQLIELAKTKTSDIEKLKILQVYFLENVEFDHIIGIADEIRDIHPSCQTVFYNQEEKERELLNFESLFGENFHFSKNDRMDLLNLLGKVVEPTRREVKFGENITYINTPNYNGGIYDSIRILVTSRPTLYQNGLIMRGVCAAFSPFVKKFCEQLGIKCEIAKSDDESHVFNLIEIDGEEKVFDFTRMIGIRDNYKNTNNSQTINDWFDMPLKKMFKFKPERQFNLLDENESPKLSEPINILNYEEHLNQQQKPKSK